MKYRTRAECDADYVPPPWWVYVVAAVLVVFALKVLVEAGRG